MSRESVVGFGLDSHKFMSLSKSLTFYVLSFEIRLCKDIRLTLIAINAGEDLAWCSPCRQQWEVK